MNLSFKRIAIFSDSWGILPSLSCIPPELVACVVGASIRPTNFMREQCQILGIDFFLQPQYNTNDYKYFLEKLKEKKIDMIFSNSYSMIVRKEVMEIVNNEAFNVHVSLLPANRGCNPIQWAIIKGETQTGITLHHMDKGIDTGCILAQHKMPIKFTDTWLDVRNQVEIVMPQFLEKTIPLLLRKSLQRVTQDESKANYNPRLNPQSPLIDFENMKDLQIYNLIRGQVSPLSGAYIKVDGKEIRFPDFIPFENIKDLREKYAKNSCLSST